MAVNDVASARVALQFDPLQASAERRLTSNANLTASNAGGIQQWGTTGTGAINNAYDILDQHLTGNRTITNNALKGQATNVGDIYRSGQDVLGAAKQQTADMLTDYGTRFGLGQYTQQVADPFLQALDRNIGTMAGLGANMEGAASDYASQIDTLMNLQQNNAKSTRGSRISDFAATIAKALSENALRGQNNENDLNATLTDLLGQRGNALTSEIDKLTQQEWEHQLEQAKLDQSAAQSSRSDALGWAQLQAQKDQQGFKDFLALQGMGQDRLDREQAQNNWQSEFGQKSTLDKEKLAAEIFASSVPRDQFGQPLGDPNATLSTLNQIRTAQGLPPFASWQQAGGSGITVPEGANVPGAAYHAVLGQGASLPPDLQNLPNNKSESYMGGIGRGFKNMLMPWQYTPPPGRR